MDWHVSVTLCVCLYVCVCVESETTREVLSAVHDFTSTWMSDPEISMVHFPMYYKLFILDTQCVSG